MDDALLFQTNEKVFIINTIQETLGVITYKDLSIVFCFIKI